MALSIKVSVASASVRTRQATLRGATLACRASLINKQSAAAIFGAGLLLMAPDVSASQMDGTASQLREAELMEIIKSRTGKDLPSVKEVPVVSAPVVAMNTEEELPVATMTSEQKAEVIRAEALRDAENAAKLSAEQAPGAKVAAPRSNRSMTTDASAGNMAPAGVGALVVLAAIGAAAANANKSGSEESAPATPVTSSPQGDTAAPAGDSSASTTSSSA